MAACLLGLVVAGFGVKQKTDARIAGVVKVCGGPLLGEKYTCTPQRGSVTVFGPDHRLVSDQQLRRGRYSFRLSPGTYELVERTNLHRLRREAKATANKTTTVNFVIEAS
jgi:hypothetical protein